MRACGRKYTMPLLLLILGFAPVHGDAGEVDPTKVVTEPPLALPGPGQVYRDPAFGTLTVRIGDPQAIGVGRLNPQYSQLQAWNADGSLLLLSGNLIFDAGTFQLLHQVDYGWPAWGNGLRWSPVDPNVLFYTGGGVTGCGGAAFMRYRLLSRAPLTVRREVVRCSPEYTQFDKDPSFEELSEDGRYVVLVGARSDGQREVFAYDIVNDVKHRPLVLSGTNLDNLDWAAISPSGKYVVIQFANGRLRFRGMEAYDLEMNYLGKVSTSSGHGDLVMDANGNEFLIQTNANNAYLLTDQHYLIKAKIPIGVLYKPDGTTVDEAATVASGATTPLLVLDWFLGLHVSCRNIRARGWCAVGTGGDGSGNGNGWQPLEEEIFKIYLNSTIAAPRVDRLAHHRSKVTEYWAHPFATVRADGAEIVFGSNWKGTVPVNSFILRLEGADAVSPAPPTGLKVQ